MFTVNPKRLGASGKNCKCPGIVRNVKFSLHGIENKKSRKQQE